MTEIERAAKKPLVLISGQEDLLRARALQGILAAIPIAPDDFDVQTFDAQSSSPIEWIGSAATSPFLAEKRVVIVRQLLNAEPPKVMDQFGALGGSGMIILVADSVGGSDDKRSKATTYGKNWEALVNKHSGVVLKYEPDPKTAKEAVKAEAIQNGVAISDKALTILIEMTGGSFSRAIEEFEKLTLFVGPNVTISERHVDAIVVPSKDWNVFKLTDSIVENNVGEALRNLRILVGTVSKAEEAAFQQILPQVSRNLKLLWQARISLDMSESLNAPSDRFKKAVPKRPSLIAEPPYRQSRLVRMARQLTLTSLVDCLQIVADTDARLKGALAGFSAIDTLESMVLELTSTMAKAR